MSTFCENEKKRLDRMNKFQLSNTFKRVGWIVVLIAFALMIAKKFYEEPSWVKPALTNLMRPSFVYNRVIQIDY